MYDRPGMQWDRTKVVAYVVMLLLCLAMWAVIIYGFYEVWIAFS